MNDLQVRIDELETRLRVALAALEAVEAVYDREGKLYCPWCGNDDKQGHRHDCLRQLALAMPPQNIGEK